MTRRSLIPLLLLLLVAATALAACGDDGPSKDEYEQGLAEVQEHLDDATEASRASGETTEVDERRGHLADAHTALDQAADTADDLQAPDDAKAAHERFATALREYARLFDQLGKLEAEDPSETALYSEAGEIADRLAKASRDLEKAGYEVPASED